MRKGLLPIAALGFCLAGAPASADVLTIPEATMTSPVMLPTKGMTMADVQKKYGEPSTKRPTVGGGSPKQPPITRWDYPRFSVIFEKDRVVDGVIPGAPPRLVNRQGLQPEYVPMNVPAAPEAPADTVLDAPVEAQAETMPMEMSATPSEAPAEAPVEPVAPEAPAETAPATPSSESEEPKPLP